MQWHDHDPGYRPDELTRVAVLEAEAGPARRELLECWRRQAADAGCRTWLLRCAPEQGGLWAGLAELIESAVAPIEHDAPGLVAAHGYEITLVLPRYRARLEVSRPLTDTVAPAEQTRNYPADRAYRSLHGLIDLLGDCHNLGDGRPWAIACDGFDRANKLVRRFFTELVRRQGEHIDLQLLVAAASGHGDEVAASFAASRCSGFRPNLAPQRGPYPDDPLVMEVRAVALEEQFEREGTLAECELPRLIDCWQRSNHPERALRWQVEAINAFNRVGLYEAALEYSDTVEANLDRLRHRDEWEFYLAVNGLFFTFVTLGQAERARRVLEDAVPYLGRSQLPRVFYLLAMLHVRFLDVKDFELADQYLHRALDLLPEADLPEHFRQFMTVFLMNGLALVRVRQRRPLDAVELCQTGLARLNRHLDPGEHRLHRSVLLYNIAQVYAQIGPDEAALDYFGQTLDMDPNYSEYYNDRGALLFRMGRLEEAERDYLDAVRLSPPYAEVHVNLGQCYRAMGRMDDAVSAYSRSLDLEPTSTLALAGRADAYTTLGITTEALADYDRALRLDPAQPMVLAGRAIIHYDEGRIWQALEDLDQAIVLAPALGELRQNRAVALLQVGQIDAAAEDLRAYVELCPDAEDRPAVELQLGSLLASATS